MAYPTTLAFKLAEPRIGASSITSVDTTQRHPLGTVVTAVDPVYGEGKFIYLAGVASTAAGDLVVFDPKAGTTTRTVAASRGPVAVAQAATVASTYGWYQIFGSAPVSTVSAGTGAANSLLAVTSTAGQATVSGTSSVKIDGAICQSTQGSPGTNYTVVLLDFPSANGNT
jgi:hypothetical protein